jgi:hypothetical protein
MASVPQQVETMWRVQANQPAVRIEALAQRPAATELGP